MTGVTWRLRVALPTLLLAALTAVPADAQSDCPNPKTCRAYVLDSYRWPVAGSRHLTIRYWVNPTNPYVPAADVPAMVAAAAHVWEVANPRITFAFDGLTSQPPGLPDGRNVIGWGPPLAPTELAHSTITSNGGVIQEADITLALTAGTHWQQCPQRNGGCAGHAAPIAPGTYTGEVQGVVEHELGHWLSLDHPDAIGGSEMTMSAIDDPRVGLTYQTLGLGDILGVRAAYPCGACGGRPVVYVP